MLRRTFLTASVIALASACTPDLFGPASAPKPVMVRSYDIQNLRFGAAPDIVVSE